jgi:threonine dehydratase
MVWAASICMFLSTYTPRATQKMASRPLQEAFKANGDVVVNRENGASTPNGSSGTNGHIQRTPSVTTLSLTEYSAQPSPPSEERSSRINKIVPDEFLLPNGHPDVSGSCLDVDLLF